MLTLCQICPEVSDVWSCNLQMKHWKLERKTTELSEISPTTSRWLSGTSTTTSFVTKPCVICVPTSAAHPELQWDNGLQICIPRWVSLPWCQLLQAWDPVGYILPFWIIIRCLKQWTTSFYFSCYSSRVCRCKMGGAYKKEAASTDRLMAFLANNAVEREPGMSATSGSSDAVPASGCWSNGPLAGHFLHLQCSHHQHQTLQKTSGTLLVSSCGHGWNATE